MAKCVGFVYDIPIFTPQEQCDTTFVPSDLRSGENAINKRLSELEELVLDIASDYTLIKQSTTDGDKWDYSQIQDAMTRKFSNLYVKSVDLIPKINSSDLLQDTKHRFFILLTCGIVNKLQHLLQIVGRLSELEQKLYLEEQRKPLISEESATIHSLTFVWCSAIQLMARLHELSYDMFKDKSAEYDFIESLESSTAVFHYSEIFLMDLTIVSWIQFNRLMKYEDLINSSPFLCPCHFKVYIKILNVASKNLTNSSIISTITPLIIDYRSKPSALTRSIRSYEMIPFEPFYSKYEQSDLAYFVIWHLYSLSRKVFDEIKPLLHECSGIMESSLKIAMSQFVPTTQTDEFRLSPHQEERFKLIFVMINHWSEKMNQSERIIRQIFLFFDTNWTLFGPSYYDNSNLRIEGLTIFQLFTKMINEIVPHYTTDGQAKLQDEKELSQDKKDLLQVWNRLLVKDKVNPKPSTSKT